MSTAAVEQSNPDLSPSRQLAIDELVRLVEGWSDAARVAFFRRFAEAQIDYELTQNPEYLISFGDAVRTIASIYANTDYLERAESSRSETEGGQDPEVVQLADVLRNRRGDIHA